ncbi:MAG: hypothetical protein CXT69_05305, partial [Methanobacteriota archaeon]
MNRENNPPRNAIGNAHTGGWKGGLEDGEVADGEVADGEVGDSERASSILLRCNLNYLTKATKGLVGTWQEFSVLSDTCSPEE